MECSDKTAPALSRQSWVSATFLLIALSLGSKVFGFVREVLVAKYFGVSSDVDAYMVAVLLPTILGGAIGVSLGASLVPTYHRMSARDGEGRANELVFTVVAFTTIVSLVLIAVLYAVPELAIRTIAPSLPDATVETAVGLLKWLSLLLLGLALFNVLTAAYNARHHFTTPAVADLLNHGCVIGALLLLSSLIGIYSLAAGLIAGVYAVIIVLLVIMWKKRLLGFRISFGTSDFKGYFVFSAPIFLNVLIPQLGGIIENYFASALKEGSIAALGYAKRLSDVGTTLMAVNLAKAVFPTFSMLSAEKRLEDLRNIVMKLNSQIVIFFMPLSVMLVYFRKEIIGLVFMRGAFGVQAMEMTASAFTFYVIAFIAYMLLPLFFRLCYAFSDSATPLKAAAAGISFMILGNWLLTPLLGIAGIALSTSLSVVLNVAILFVAVRHRLGGLGARNLAKSFYLSLLCAVAALLPLVLLGREYSLHLAIGVTLYLLLYFLLGWLFLRAELSAFLATVGATWGRKR